MTFDIILIDGIKREDCAREACKLINNGGLLILDNSDRHPEVAQYLREKGSLKLIFMDLGQSMITHGQPVFLWIRTLI